MAVVRFPFDLNAFHKCSWRFMKSGPAARAFGGMGVQRALLSLFPRATQSGKAGKIWQVGLRLTDRCNLRCLTCGQWGPEGYLRKASIADLAKRELPAAVYGRLFKDLFAAGHKPFVYLWGGEPLLYPELDEVLAAAAKNRFPVSMATNGARLPELAETLSADPMHIMQVSIDAPRSDLHNAIRPAAGGGDSFDRLCRGLEALWRARRDRKSPLPLIVSLTTISRANQHCLAEILQRFHPWVDLMVFYLSWWIDAPRAQKHEAEFKRRFGFQPTVHRGWLGVDLPDAHAELDREIARLRRLSRAYASPPVVILPHITGESNLRDYYTDHGRLFGFNRCLSIFHNLEVNSNGDVSPCRDYNDFVVGNLARQSLQEIWNSPAYVGFRRSMADRGLMPVCSRCCGLMGF